MTALLESILLVFVVVFFVFFSSFFSSKKSPSFALVPPPARSLVAAAPLVTPEENAREEDEERKEEEKAKDRRLPAKKEFKRGESGSLVVVPVVVEGENNRIREDILLIGKLAATPTLKDFSLVVVAFFSPLILPLPEKREERRAEDANRREAREERIFLTISV